MIAIAADCPWPGFEAGLIPRPAFFHFRFTPRIFCGKVMSSHQQDLPHTTLLCRCLSLGRFTEWQFQANRDL